MSRTAIPVQTSDISGLARSLRAQLANQDTVPGHVELLNMLARSVGCRNFQQLRAQTATAQKLAVAAAEPPPEPPGRCTSIWAPALKTGNAPPWAQVNS